MNILPKDDELLTQIQFQVYNAFGYLTIPGTAFVSFLYLGFLEIGQEM